MIFRVELDEKEVENDPPKKRFELAEFGAMIDTGPLRPVNGTVCQDEDVVDHSATLDPFPFGAEKDPPTQTSVLSESQDKVLTVPVRPLRLLDHDDDVSEYDAMFDAVWPFIDVKDPPIYTVPFPSPDNQQRSFTLPPAFVTPITLYAPSAVRTKTVSPSAEKRGVDEDEEVEAKGL